MSRRPDDDRHAGDRLDRGRPTTPQERRFTRQSAACRTTLITMMTARAVVLPRRAPEYFDSVSLGCRGALAYRDDFGRGLLTPSIAAR